MHDVNTVNPEPRTEHISANAPVTIDEIVAVCGGGARGWRKRAVRENWPRAGAGHFYAVQDLPNEVRSRVAARRETALNALVNVGVAEQHRAEPREDLPGDFSEREQALAKLKRKFVLDVERSRHEHPEWTLPECVRAVVRAAERLHPHPYTDERLPEISLTTAGKNGRTQLSLDGSTAASFPALNNYKNWRERWQPFHGPFRAPFTDTYQWWALCDRHGEKGKPYDVASERPGDDRFWSQYRAMYESPARRLSHEECYRDCCARARAEGWREVPSLRQVKYFYANKLTDAEKRSVERARMGKKFHYDKLSIWIMRDWRRVEPDTCWSLDHHVFDVFCRRWDEEKKGWVKCRPWITNVIDASSWYEVGRHFTFDPSRDSIEFALRDALVRQRRAPEILYFDNGKDFRSIGRGLGFDEQRMTEVVGALGEIRSIFALPHNPRAKVNERDYLTVINWFEKKQPTYCGGGPNKSQFDARWQDLRKDYLVEDSRGCLANWQHLPTLEDLARAYAIFREQDRHQRVSQGRICHQQSPAAKYLNAPVKRKLGEDEIQLSFLREVGRQTIDQNARVWYQPPGMSKAERLYFQDEPLMDFRDREVVVKFDTVTMRCFVFAILPRSERGEGDDLKLVRCSGPHGSVPAEFMPDPFRASHEQLREHKRKINKWQKGARIGRTYQRYNEAAEEIANEVSRDTGMTPAAARAYVVQPAEIIDRAEHRDGRAKALTGIQVPDAEADAWLKGTTEERQP